jgi:hypothetical protein
MGSDRYPSAVGTFVLAQYSVSSQAIAIHQPLGLLPTWDVDKEVFLIMAIRGQSTHHNNNQDEQR